MAIRSGIFGAITAVVLTLLAGNRWVIDNLPSGGPAPNATRSVAAFFSWDPDRVFRDFRVATYVALVVFILATALLGAAAGRARPLAAFVGGWGAAVGAGAVSGIVFSLVAGEAASFQARGELVDRAYTSATNGTGPMIILGWLVGLAVLLGSFGAKQPKAAPSAGQAPPPGPPVADPYPPAPPVSHPYPPAPPPPGPGAPVEGPTPTYGTPAPTAPPAPPPPGPSIGPPPDRTQVYGRPPE